MKMKHFRKEAGKTKWESVRKENTRRITKQEQIVRKFKTNKLIQFYPIKNETR